MKKQTGLVWLMLGLLSLNGCAQETEEEAVPMFHISAQTQSDYIEQLDDLVNVHYWNYDQDSLSFSNGVVPQNGTVLAASLEIGLDLAPFVAEESVVATANLLHYNGDDAGQISAIFVNDDLVGAYYHGGYDHSVYALTLRNPYLADGQFRAYETWEGMGDAFTQTWMNVPPEGFLTLGQTAQQQVVAVQIEGGDLLFSPLQTSAHTEVLRLQEHAIAVTAHRGGYAALVGSTPQAEQEVLFGHSLVFVNEAFALEEQLALSNDDYTAIAADGAELLLFAPKRLEVYTQDGEGVWSMTERLPLRHNIFSSHITDLDGDGEKEYLLSDGLDLYVYQRKDSGLLKVWSTHLGVESLYGPLYSGDLNADGVLEVYVADATGTTIRYLLLEDGLQSSNEDIVYGQAIYPVDWDLDGLWDYQNTLQYEEETVTAAGFYHAVR